MQRGRAVQKALKLRSSQQILEQEDDDFQEISPLATQQSKRTLPAPARNFASRLDDDDPPLELKENIQNSVEQINERPRITRKAYPQPPVTQPRQETGRLRQAPVSRKRQYYEEDFVDDDPPLIENDRPAYAALPRRPTMPSTRYMDDMEGDPSLPSREELQEKLDRLLRIRYTEPEALCKRFEEVADQHNKDSDALIERMQLELESNNKEMLELRNELMRSQQSLDTEKEQHSSEVAVLKAKLAHLQAQRSDPMESRLMQSDTTLKDTIETYEDLSGLIITDIKRTDDGYAYNCVQSGNKSSMHFRLLRHDGRTRQYFYEPMLDPARDSAVLEQLSGTMSREVSFRQDQAPVFHCKLAYSLLQSKK